MRRLDAALDARIMSLERAVIAAAGAARPVHSSH
jgi:hypothetical protein